MKSLINNIKSMPKMLKNIFISVKTNFLARFEGRNQNGSRFGSAFFYTLLIGIKNKRYFNL